jgi:hypothetical protein
MEKRWRYAAEPVFTSRCEKKRAEDFPLLRPSKMQKSFAEPGRCRPSSGVTFDGAGRLVACANLRDCTAKPPEALSRIPLNTGGIFI